MLIVSSISSRGNNFAFGALITKGIALKSANQRTITAKLSKNRLLNKTCQEQ